MNHATPEKAAAKRSAKLIDTTKCVGCRSCQVACKSWNGLPGEKTELPTGPRGMQNPAALSASTFSILQSSEVEDPRAPGGLRLVFTKRGCMHCEEPACAAACPVTAMHKTPEGPVVYDDAKCVGCRYCMWACPFGVPTAEWSSLAPKIRKCTGCHDRLETPASVERNGVLLTSEELTRYAAAQAVPACVKSCPAGALSYGDRDAMLAEAHRRIAESPGKYVAHVYGEKEAGGTDTLYLASVPFGELGLPDVGLKSYPAPSRIALGAVPPAVLGVGAVLGGAYALSQRRTAVAREETAPAQAERKTLPRTAPATVQSLRPKQDATPAPAAHAEPHVEFEPLARPLWTPVNLLLAGVMGLGAMSFAARFALGLGRTTSLSDTHAWGLWIVFDLIWIAIAAGAFASAGLIYCLRRTDLYSVGRTAVLLGLLSYSFVTVTLVADLGLPWHAWQLAFNAPSHSAMFEVSWCVGLYVTVLMLEFLPVPLERWGLVRWTELWRRYAPWYVAGVLTLFVYLVSRSVLYAGAAAALFSGLAYAFRARPGVRPEPIMLAIAAVTLSTMHQSSLGSLFLLMPDKLAAQWWSPVMPISFFLSSISAGTALLILVELWIARAWNRQVRPAQLAAIGRIAFAALFVALAFRLGDLAFRGLIGSAFTGPKGGLFTAEVVVGGLVPLLLLAIRKVRETPWLLGVAAFLSCAGVVLHRVDVVLLGMQLRGIAPAFVPQAYAPSFVEWSISAGVIAAAIFLFGLGVRLLPVLPKEGAARS